MEDGIFNAQPGAFQRAVEQLQEESESEEEEEEEYEVTTLVTRLSDTPLIVIPSGR